jgi:2-hydroxychromene-2-carboxylate isomerase
VKTVDFWFDPISPYAYLAFERLPIALEGVSYNVVYRPVLFGALLKHHDHKGPAEIEPKRAFTFRQVQWLADRFGIPLQTPAEHPFNPLALLRLCYACAGPGSVPNRHVCSSVLHHVWRGDGASATDAERMAALTRRLAPNRDPAGEEVKAALKEQTARAIGLGVFGVPTLGVDGRLFWGLDSLEMVAACLRDDPWFVDGGPWDRAGAARPGLRRRT